MLETDNYSLKFAEEKLKWNLVDDSQFMFEEIHEDG